MELPDLVPGAGQVVIAVTVAATTFVDTQLAEEALGAAAEDRLVPTVGLVVPLERAAEARAAMEGRLVIGKTLLVPSPKRVAPWP